MSRRPLSTKGRAALFAEHGGLCHICGGKIHVGEAWEVEHVIALAAGGDDEAHNMRPAHVKCHKAKTAEDMGVIAKVKRIRDKHAGAYRKRSRLPGSRDSRFKKKINGEVVLR